MAKKKEDPPPAGSPAWMGTFADLNNLLLCFFVLLFSMSTLDAAKFEEIAASFSQAFGILTGGASSLGQGALIGQGISQLNELSSYISSMGLNEQGQREESAEGEAQTDESGMAPEVVEEQSAQSIAEEEQLEASAELAELISEALNEANILSDVELDFNSQYVQLTLQGSILFDSGKVEIKEQAIPILDKVGVILYRYAGGTIEIEGHTDNVPMSGAKYSNNDELSAGRALSVFYYLIDTTDLNPAKILHTGRGEYDPVADNSTPEGRARNRRVEIRIYNPLSPSY